MTKIAIYEKLRKQLYGGISNNFTDRQICPGGHCLESRGSVGHYDDTPMQYTAIFHGCKNGNFQMKNYDI